MKPDFFGNLFVKLIVLSLGCILLLPSAYKFYSYVIFRSHAVSVYGNVEKAMGSGITGGRPFIGYKDTQGKAHSFKSKAKTNWFFTPKKGDKIKVLFLENDPQKAIVDSLFYYILLPISFCLIGIMFILYVFQESWRELNKYRCRSA